MSGCFVTLNADTAHLSLLHELSMVAINMLLRIILLYSEYFSCHFADPLLSLFNAKLSI